jgi:hypothetical protein
VLDPQAILLTTVDPLSMVKLDVPTAPDQVTSNGAPAVRPVNEPVNARAAIAPRIPNATRHNCRTNSWREKNLILQFSSTNNLITKKNMNRKETVATRSR